MNKENSSSQKCNVIASALTENDAAKYIAMSPHYLRRDRCYGPDGGRTGGPPWVKMDRAVRYLKKDLDEWLQQRRRCHSDFRGGRNNG
ncbi:helix-turn-helix domain-containing protein [Gammaproteobacteria bacterium]|nr:helix-turn-helix domain-containing protein [Gammaproteobacteria bacterium]